MIRGPLRHLMCAIAVALNLAKRCRIAWSQFVNLKLQRLPDHQRCGLNAQFLAPVIARRVEEKPA
jgi:hypothetical protein